MWLAFSNTPVHTLEDIQGMRIRTMESPIMTRSIELLGAAPISVTVSELTVAMQTGMFEGMIVALSPGYIRYLGYLDYNAYIFEFPITYTIAGTAMNADWYLGLPDEARLAFETIRCGKMIVKSTYLHRKKWIGGPRLSPH
jgi:TRAP-type C4-dicarboxylate transport system substrate-binding protein